mmetsp:Transcript_2549/g.2653  ORF Transcript_2549/g.2653 Transcript_2549/m.2653 type:complete len:219 (-) Transcript_2549:63-719(-)|eukprot:CAMPEP_0119034672 /NCGR_PEP_ID=MMETSP1177-20130426/1684_1 /TAXON_ID=2985 /ORGANISM="Ochromonas sp, Strain CCMP1899" /LENGTH=218 /DNA_ID=CAMNT_0006992285 /DNA_START=199 /DNA_END=855 /DNA_ORIENTATION=-
MISELSSVDDSSTHTSVDECNVVVKIALIGDAQVGKTTLMVKFKEGTIDDDYIQSLGVNFMEKTVYLQNTSITFSTWDIGKSNEFLSILPLVCNDSVAIFFMFDLSRKSTLLSVKEWYRQARRLNRNAHAFLIGTKYDIFCTLNEEIQAETDRLARKYAQAMNATLVFISASHSVNVQRTFKVVLSKVFQLKCSVEEITGVGEPVLLYKTEHKEVQLQ